MECCSQLVPGESGVLQSLLHINILAAVVHNDDVEVGVSRYSEQFLHFRDQLTDPAALVFH